MALCAGCAGQVQYEGSSSAGLSADKFYCEREVRSVTDLAKQEVAMQTCMQGKGGRSNAIEGFPRTGSRPRITALIDQAPILRKETWPERFATHLLVLRPQLTALEAASVAADEYEELCDFEPEVAAAMYADDSTDI